MTFFNVFRPFLLGPIHTSWHRIYTKLGEFQINTLLLFWKLQKRIKIWSLLQSSKTWNYLHDFVHIL